MQTIIQTMMRMKISSRRALELIDQRIWDGWNLMSIHSQAIRTSVTLADESQRKPKLDVQVPQAIDALNQWTMETMQIIESIFIDKRQVVGFVQAKYFGGLISNEPAPANKWFEKVWHMEERIEFLCTLYDDIKQFVRVPLDYLSDQNRLVHFEDSIILRGAGESSLCAFMFKQDYGIPVESEDIHNHVNGIETEYKPKQIWDLAEQVNKKTRERWGFALFGSTQGMRQIVLNPPSPSATFPGAAPENRRGKLKE